MMMRATLLGISVALVIAGCGQSEAPSTAEAPPAAMTEVPPAVPEPPSVPPPNVEPPPAPLPAASVDALEPKPESAPRVESKPQTPPKLLPKPETKAVSKSAAAQTEAAKPNKEESLALAIKAGCLACHAVDHKVVGPAWQDVAAKYKGDGAAYARLVEKVKKGGKGNWTEVTGGVPMPPYSPRVADQDIETLVRFILAL